MGFKNVAFLLTQASFLTPHVIETVIEVKASTLPHVLIVWLEVSKGILPVKYFSNKASFYISYISWRS